MSYEYELKIWIVGVREKEHPTIWTKLWKPTGPSWFWTRKDCQRWISHECKVFRHLEYKPLRYGPVQRKEK